MMLIFSKSQLSFAKLSSYSVTGDKNCPFWSFDSPSRLLCPLTSTFHPILVASLSPLDCQYLRTMWVRDIVFFQPRKMCYILDTKCPISIVWDLESNLHLIRSLKLTNIFESQSFVFVNFLEFRFFNFMCFVVFFK